MVCCVWHACDMRVAWVKGFVMVALAQWLFKFGKVMFGWNTWSVIGGMVAMVLHRWHGRKGLSKGYISGGLFVMVVYLRYFVVGGISVIVLFLCGSCVCGRLLLLCCRGDKNCSFLRQFRAPLARKFINTFNVLRNFLDATFCHRNVLKWKIIGPSLYRDVRGFSAALFSSRTIYIVFVWRDQYDCCTSLAKFAEEPRGNE